MSAALRAASAYRTGAELVPLGDGAYQLENLRALIYPLPPIDRLAWSAVRRMRTSKPKSASIYGSCSSNAVARCAASPQEFPTRRPFLSSALRATPSEQSIPTNFFVLGTFCAPIYPRNMDTAGNKVRLPVLSSGWFMELFEAF